MSEPAARLYALTGDECGSLKMLINSEFRRLLNQSPRNETMISMFQNILVELRRGRPLS